MVRRWILTLIALVVVGAVVGCAATPVEFNFRSDVFGSKNRLKQNFLRYWSLRAKGEVEAAFALEAPYIQEMVGLDYYKRYLKLYKARLQKLEVKKVSCPEPFYCELECRSVWMGKKDRQDVRWFKDRWVKVSGNWYHVLKDPLFFPQL